MTNGSITTSGSSIQFDDYWRNAASTNLPAFYVKTNQGIMPSGTTVTWGTTVFDNGNDMGSQLFTAPRDGIYFFYCWLMSENDGSNINDYFSIRKNNSNSGYTNTKRNYSTSTTAHHKQWSGGTTFSLSSGDNVRVVIDRMDNGMYANSTSYTAFCGCYLGRQ